MEELEPDELMDGEFLQVDSTGDQSMDGLSQESIDAGGLDFQMTDEVYISQLSLI